MFSADYGGSPVTAFSAVCTTASSALVLQQETPAAARHSMVCSSWWRMMTALPPPFVVPPVAEPSLQMLLPGVGRAARARSAACRLLSGGSDRRVVVGRSIAIRTDPDYGDHGGSGDIVSKGSTWQSSTKASFRIH